MSCTRDRWLDVFVTKPDAEYGQEYDFDDEFLCTMRSVEVNEQVLSPPNKDGVVYRAAIVGHATEYLLPTWTANYKEGGTANAGGFGDHLLRQVKAGDIIRIGSAGAGQTDYLTVVEVIHVSEIWNATGLDYRVNATTPGKVAISATDSFNGQFATLEQQQSGSSVFNSNIGVGSLAVHSRSPQQTGGIVPNGQATKLFSSSTLLPNNGHYIEPGTAGIAHIVLRVNVKVSATPPPQSFYSSAGTGMMKFSSLHSAMENLHQAIIPITDKRGVQKQQLVRYDAYGVPQTEEIPLEVLPYPVYLNKNWASGSTLYAHLDHGVKSLTCIKLVGYSIVNKRQVGIVHQNEMINDDYFVLHINEIEGKIISNNKHANGAFAVLHVPVGNQSEGAIEHSRFDPDGIVTHYLDNCDSTIRNLTIKVTDRKGQPAHIGRLHLWFKLRVLHG